MCVCLLCPRIDPLSFLAGCCRRRLNQGLVVALDFSLIVRYGMFLCYFFGLWVHALFSSLPFCYQYRCNWLPWKIRLRNDLLCVECDVKPCSAQLSSVIVTVIVTVTVTVTRCILFTMQAVVWSGSGDVRTDGGDHAADWKAFSVPLELEDSVTAVDFAPVSLFTGR